MLLVVLVGIFAALVLLVDTFSTTCSTNDAKISLLVVLVDTFSCTTTTSSPKIVSQVVLVVIVFLHILLVHTFCVHLRY